MTPEQQRIAIAEACGWRFHPTRHILLAALSPIPSAHTTANKTLFLHEDADITGFILTNSDGTKHFVDSGAVITLDATKSFNLFHPNAHTN